MTYYALTYLGKKWVTLGEYYDRKEAVRAAKRCDAASIVVYDAGTRCFLSAQYPYTLDSATIGKVRAIPAFADLTI